MNSYQRWAVEQTGLSAITKSVLNALASMSNRTGECFPSVPFIAKACGISDRSVQRSLNDLSARKLLTISPRKRERRGQTSNLYKLLKQSSAAAPDNASATAAVTVSPPPDPIDARPGDHAVTQNSAFGRNEPHSEPESICGAKDEEDLTFPPDLSSEEQRSMRTVLRSVSQSVAQTLLDEMRGRMRSQPPIANRCGYLRALLKRYREGGFVAEHAGDESRRRQSAKARQRELAASSAPRTICKPSGAIRSRLDAARAALLAKPSKHEPHGS